MSKVNELFLHFAHALEALRTFIVLFEGKYLLEEVYGIK